LRTISSVASRDGSVEGNDAHRVGVLTLNVGLAPRAPGMAKIIEHKIDVALCIRRHDRAQEIERLGLQETRARLHDLVGYIDMTHSGIVPVGSTVDVQAAALFQEALE
jgi:hypothetical protein